MADQLSSSAGAGRLDRCLDSVGGLIDRLTGALNVVGTLLIVALMVLVNSDVIGRSFLDAPVSGVPEMVSLSIVAIVFLQVAQAFRQGRFTRSEALLGWLGKHWPRLRCLLELAFGVASVWVIFALYRASYPLFWKSFDRDTYVGTVGDFIAPVWPVKLLILIGCLALLAQLVMHVLRQLLGVVRGGAVPPTGQSADRVGSAADESQGRAS